MPYSPLIALMIANSTSIIGETSYQKPYDCVAVRISDREQLIKYLRAILLNHLRGEPILLADLRIEIRRGTFDALLSFDIQSPQPEALSPAALPFEVIHQRPVEISLHGPVEIDRPPHLVDMLRQITRTHVIV